MIKNNAVSDLQTKILPESTSFICKKWEWELFPISNFEVFLEFFENWIVTKRESIFIRERKWDVFLISERWFDFCVQNDLNSRERWKKALEFEIWSKISQYFSENYLKNIEEKIENTENKKLDKSDTLVTQFNSANQLVKLWADWKLPALDGSNLRNIQAETKNLNLNFVAWENIEAESFVFIAKEQKTKKVFFDNDFLWNWSQHSTEWRITFKKHPWKFKKVKINRNVYWTWYLTLTKDAWGSQVFLKILLKSDKNEYSSADFTNYDENYDLTWKTLYIRSDWYFSNTNIKNEITVQNNPFFYLETEINTEVGKIYNADCFTKWKIFYLKDAVNKGQTAKVLTSWFIENLNLPENKKDIYLNWIWKATQVETDLKIWEKITNSIMELKNSEEKLPLIFHNLTLEAYNYSSSTTQTITIQHNLWFVKDFQVLAYNKAQKQFYGMWKNLVSGGSEIDCKISENLFNSLKIEIRRKLVPELELRFLLI